ncbi:MAG TPA: FCD domain-containing protein [Vineibacter sp.]|nr:FCD domain-containing protein [Vineibacter sp.]
MASMAPLPDPTAAAETLTERVTAILQRNILSGVLAPDSKLRIQALAARLDIGTTPIREGLSRLASQGLVQAIGQRGFRVASVSKGDLEDITRTRTLIEVEALRLSMARGDDLWEAGIVASLHRMRKFTARGTGRFREGVADFDAVHKAFHTALIAACGSQRLLDLHSALYDQAYRYRRVMMTRFERPSQLDDEHQILADLTLARDTGGATAKLAEHLASTLAIVYPPTNKAKEERTNANVVKGDRRRRAVGRARR